MYLAMLKKDLKQFFREKFNIIILIVFPIVLISTLSVGLQSMMDGGNVFKEDGEHVVYYSIEKDSPYKEGFLGFGQAMDESINVKFKEEKNFEDIKEKVDNNQALAYISFKGEEIEYYTSANGAKIEGRIFNEIFNSFLKEYGSYETIGTFNKAAFMNFVQNKYDTYVEEERINGAKKLTAGEFYTFAELALIISFLGLTIGEMTFKEKRLKTVNRIIMSKSSHLIMLLSKISLGVIIGTLQTLLVYGYTSLVLKVEWGENTVKFLVLFIIYSLFMSITGAVIGSLCKKEGMTSGILNIFSFVWGALGGCFTPLSMIISIPVLNKLVYLSPIYWITTATSTMICGFQTIAYKIAMGIPIVFSIIFLLVYFLKSRDKEAVINA
ncbi:MAG: ABC transporter permease [Clostridium sp.]